MTRPRLRSERSDSQHLAPSSSTSLTMKSADPPIPPADLRNEEIQLAVVTNPYWEKMNAVDTDGAGDDDAADDDDDERGYHDARRSDLSNHYKIFCATRGRQRCLFRLVRACLL